MVEIDILERTYTTLELLALAEDMTPAGLLDKIVHEYKTADERALIAQSAQKMKMRDAA